jgi:hypothetical protein
MDIFLAQAIKNFVPNSEFTIKDNDYSTIEWHVLEGKAPTKAQIEAEIVKIKSNQVAASEEKATAKAALLERLGITADEAALLLS